MQIEAKIKYQEEYLPTKRHRIPRIREIDETVMFELREIKKDDAPVAMIVTDYKSYLDENGNDNFGLREIPFHAIEGQLYSEKRDMWGALDKGTFPLKSFISEVERHGNCLYGWVGKSKEEVLRSVNAFITSHVMIDGIIYEQKGEPRYVINTFGLGHNHGGTGMFISYGYNPNISESNYFNALQRDEAIAYANEVAARRGDTDSVGKFGAENIRVFMPELIRCNPNLEHGDGNPLLNSLEGIIQASSNSLEAGLLVMGTASSHITEGKKPTLAAQIQSAAVRNDSSQTTFSSHERGTSEPEH